MQHQEMVALIQAGVPSVPSIWADLGAGSGNFTAALRDLLPAASVIYAVDRDRHAIAAQHSRWQATPDRPPVTPLLGYITADLALPQLDGILLANVLHFMRDQPTVLRHLTHTLRPGGRLLLVEYDLTTARSYVPFPLSSAQFPALVVAAGFSTPRIIGTRRSPSSGIVMYAAVAELLEVSEDISER
ncbi:MAG: class I SAM-dependent methyltransferase [Herpetosiphonaceae bacterium]|nr:class I SAM-dependent methyltransferase [Herpetosiphonaceae bacterium]